MASEGTATLPAKPFERLTVIVDLTAKTLAIVGLPLYGMGLLVNNTYLAKYGLINFAILKPQAILTGIWTLALFAIAALPSFSLAVLLTDEKRSGRARWFWVPCGFVALLWISSFLAAGFYHWFLADTAAHPDHLLRLDNGVPGWRELLVLFSGFPALLVLVSLSRPRPPSLTPLRSALLVWGMVLIPAAVLGTGVIGYETYETVRPERGGGSPPDVYFYFSSEGQDLLAQLRKVATPYHDRDPVQTIKGDLLYDTGDRYLLRINYCGPDIDKAASDTKNFKPRSELVLLDRRLVEGVIDSSPLASGNRVACPSETGEKD
jgi:hypothetical protein